MIDEDGAGQPEFDHRRRIGTGTFETHTSCSVNATDHPCWSAHPVGEVGEIDHHTVMVWIEADCVEDASIGQIRDRRVPFAVVAAAGQPTHKIGTPLTPTRSTAHRQAELGGDQPAAGPDLPAAAWTRGL